MPEPAQRERQEARSSPARRQTPRHRIRRRSPRLQRRGALRLRRPRCARAATSRSVSPAIAETTTARPRPGLRSAATMRATRAMRSTSPTDVPPNFITRRDMRDPLRRSERSSRRALSMPAATRYLLDLTAFLLRSGSHGRRLARPRRDRQVQRARRGVVESERPVRRTASAQSGAARNSCAISRAATFGTPASDGPSLVSTCSISAAAAASSPHRWPAGREA